MESGRIDALAVCHVVLPVMPRTEDNMPGYETLRERTRPVSAPVLDGMERSVDIEEGHVRAVQDDASGLPRRKFLRTNGFHPRILGAARVPPENAADAESGSDDSMSHGPGPSRLRHIH